MPGTVEDLVLGSLLEGRHRARAGAGGVASLGTPQERRTRALLRNAGAPRGAQSVVKRIVGGSTRTPAELKRLLDYVAREEGVASTWCNLAGYVRDFDPRTTGRIVDGWSATWRGAPKRGHTDHIILSFPRGTDPVAAEAVARDWGHAIFGSGDFGDVWRYVAALHRDTDHVHAHFVVDKHGIDAGRFLSICRHAALDFEVMRELHAEIAQAHGLNIVASSRLSRGLVENAPRETAMRAAHAAGAAPPAPPPMSEAERARRLAVLRAHAEEYDSLGRIARLAVGPEVARDGAAGFLTRLSRALGASAEALGQGRPLMPDTSLHAEGDAAARIAAARAETIAAAAEAWAAIRAMEPSAERVALERSFAAQARATLPLAPASLLLAEHARVAAAEEDPYRHPMLTSLARLEQGAGEGPPLDAGLRAALADLRDAVSARLAALFAPREDDLRAARTGAEEMAARVLAADRSEGQLAAWRDQPTPEAQVLWRETERDLARAVDGALRGLDLAPALAEALARDQLLTAGRHLRLSEVPALAALADRVSGALPPDDLARVRAGDPAPLSGQIRDPALRAAVAQDLRSEGDPGQGATVGPWADLLRSRSRAAELGQREPAAECNQGLEL